MAHRTKKLFLTSGSHEAAMEQYGVRSREIERLMRLSEVPLPERLLSELDV